MKTFQNIFQAAFKKITLFSARATIPAGTETVQWSNGSLMEWSNGSTADW